MYVYIYINLPRNFIVRLPHPRSGDSQGYETFLASSPNKHTQIYIYIYIYIYIHCYKYELVILVTILVILVIILVGVLRLSSP